MWTLTKLNASCSGQPRRMGWHPLLPSCHPSSSSSPLCLVDSDVSQLFQASSHAPSLAQHQSFPRKISSTKGFSVERQCWLVGHRVPVLYKIRVAFQWEIKCWVNSAAGHANLLSLLPHELGCFIGACCFYRRPWCSPGMWLLQVQADQLLLLRVLRTHTPALRVPLADTGCISLPTSSQTPQTDTFVWGIQSQVAAWVWSPLPGSCQPLPGPICPQHPTLLLPSPSHPGSQAVLLLPAPTPSSPQPG